MTNHFLIRLSFIATLIFLFLSDLVPMKWESLVANLASDLLACGTILLMTPLSFEDGTWAARYALAVSLLAVSTGVLARRVLCLGPVVASALRLLPPLGLCLGRIVHLMRCRLRNVRQLFSSNAVMHNIEELSRLLFFSLLLFISAAQIAFSQSVASSAIVLCLSLCSCVFLYYRSYCGSSGLLTKKNENRIRNLVRGDLRCAPVVPEDDAFSMNQLYKRIMKYMEMKQPYLNPDFNLGELSRSVYTNKSYVSRTVHSKSGRHFCSFVNYHRIRYALGVIEEEPELTVMDLAIRSGFRSVVSFSSAFKDNVNENPSDYIRRLRRKRIRSAS